jgi:hypothetical protein
MRLLRLVVLSLGLLSLWLNASCSAQNACGGSAGVGGTGGSSAGTGGSNCTDTAASAGSGGATTCDYLTALQACLTSFCRTDGASTPFCGCFTRGFDLEGADGTATACQCKPFDPSTICGPALAAGLVGSDLDCSASTGAIAPLCVGVQ